MVDLTFQDFIALINNFGFPIALSFYLVFYLGKKIRKLDERIEELNKLFTKTHSDKNKE